MKFDIDATTSRVDVRTKNKTRKRRSWFWRGTASPNRSV